MHPLPVLSGVPVIRKYSGYPKLFVTNLSNSMKTLQALSTRPVFPFGEFNV